MNAPPEDQLEQLKNLLFSEEIEKFETISEEFNDYERLEKKLEPILEKRIAELQADFPDQFGPVITEALKVQIKESQEEVIEVLSPIMGRLIKKYVQTEIAKLTESIDQRMRELFSFKATLRRWIASMRGVSSAEIVVSELIPAELQEVMVIENDSGLLIGRHSVSVDSDPDVIAGMLTAIKAFVEDAYGKTGESLEQIEYETFTLYLQSFSSFYIVAAVSGVVDSAFKDKLNDAVHAFAIKLTGNKSYHKNEAEMLTLMEQHFALFSPLALPLGADEVTAKETVST